MMKNETTPKPFYKNKVFLVIAVILVLAILGKMVNTEDKPKATEQTKTETTPNSNQTDVNEKALIEIRKEKNVAEAIITDAHVLYVSVKDDGTRRDGYAQYLCQLLKDNGSKINTVKITKVGSTNDPKRDNAYGVLLGESNCR